MLRHPDVEAVALCRYEPKTNRDDLAAPAGSCLRVETSIN